MKRCGNIKDKSNNYILILSLITQVIFITTSSTINFNLEQSTSYNNVIIQSFSYDSKASPIRYYLSSVNEKESLVEIGQHQLLFRRIPASKGSSQHYIRAHLYGLLSVIILCFGHVINRKKQSKKILADNMGGHAPPHGNRLAYINL